MSTDEISIDDGGRFQIPAEELAEVAAYLRANEVPCDVEEADAFRADGRPYSIVRLRHLYDVETAVELYRKWREYQGASRQEAGPHA